MSDEKLSPPEREFAEQVRKLRDEKGWSQAELADLMVARGISYANPSTISRIESGSRPVRMVEAQVLSRLFDRTVDGMMHPDGREVILRLYQGNHSAARKAYAALKTAAQEAAEHQMRNNAELPNVRALFKADEEIDPVLKSKLDNLIRNMEQYSTIDLEEAVREAIEVGRAKRPRPMPQATYVRGEARTRQDGPRV